MKVAILGSSGAVGCELLKILEERNFPIGDLVLLSSSRSAGKKILWKGLDHITKEVNSKSFENIDLVFASAGASVSREWLSSILNQKAILDYKKVFL